MIIKQIWTGNAYRNFNYLIVCEETGEALAVDPLDHKKCLAEAKANGWTIAQILNTHEHHDHTGGNQALIAATGAKLLAHENARNAIPGIDIGLTAGDVVKVGKRVELLALDTPGHTMSHICLLSQTDEPALICGDTLFNAGAGNCHSGGHPRALYQTFAGQLSRLADNTKIYPGHDYISNNLAFTLAREPDNARAKALYHQLEHQDPARAYVSTLGVEKEVNTFFRLHSPTIIRKLQQEFPDMSEQPGPKEVFLKLRELRNLW
ncbi:hydroxyacylglutathione hydrolase [Thalassomonas viridans]|uniref:Hydroxyacylglutathione hydrolase n=1 Tax=Thalassomonas viridans TaxID=137584 RepID=A0AAE9Z9E5_9GAMM|nr:hydroxyacylglutathione hydrolase [Thalassomonas viridans]WDE09141.1 hydroxyacylglutathione hydrolase [Thalassomonas viridans]